MSFQHYDGLSPDLILIGKSMQVAGLLLSPTCRLCLTQGATFHQTERALRLKALLWACSEEEDPAAHFRHMHGRIAAALTVHLSKCGGEEAFWGVGGLWFETTAAFGQSPDSKVWAPSVATGKVCRLLFGYEPLDALDARLLRDFPAPEEEDWEEEEHDDHTRMAPAAGAIMKRKRDGPR
jgi:hypothetical protein